MSIGIRYKFIENKTGGVLTQAQVRPYDGEDRQLKVFVRHLSAADIGANPGQTKNGNSGGCLVGVVDNISDVLMIEGKSYFREYKAASNATEFELIDCGSSDNEDPKGSVILYNLMPNGEIRVLDSSANGDASIGLEADDIIVVKVYMGAPYPGTNFKAYDPSI